MYCFCQCVSECCNTVFFYLIFILIWRCGGIELSSEVLEVKSQLYLEMKIEIIGQDGKTITGNLTMRESMISFTNMITMNDDFDETLYTQTTKCCNAKFKMERAKLSFEPNETFGRVLGCVG